MPAIPTNRFKQAILNREVQIGLWTNIRDATVLEMLADSGFDWINIDCEHGSYDLSEVVAGLQAMKAGAASSMVRVPGLDPVTIKRFLDAGAQTLFVPYIQTVEEAELAAASVAYPGAGIRGVAGGTRATGFGAYDNYFGTARDEVCLIVQIETQLGLDNLEAIAAVPGIDAIFIGPSDLAASLGYIGNLTAEPVKAAIKDAIQRITAAGKPAGFLARNRELLELAKEAGAVFICPEVDMPLLRDAAMACVAKHADLK
jgi:4-hydroxy-2-oxoheptanedioate aldolase